MATVIKAFDNLRLDFNQLTDLLSSHNFSSRTSGNLLPQFFLQSSYQIFNVHSSVYFKNIIDKAVKKFNLYGINIDVDIFVGFTQGSSSIIHDDPYDVLIYSLYGDTMYIVDKKQYILKPGDIIRIKKGEVHQGIGLSPRICLSIGVGTDIKNNKDGMK